MRTHLLIFQVLDQTFFYKLTELSSVKSSSLRVNRPVTEHLVSLGHLCLTQSASFPPKLWKYSPPRKHTHNQTLTWAPMTTIYLAIKLDENLDGRFPQSKHYVLIIGFKSHTNSSFEKTVVMGKHIPIHQIHCPFPNVCGRRFSFTPTKHPTLCHTASLSLQLLQTPTLSNSLWA